MSEGAKAGAKGVVVAHGEMARGLVDAVKRISGHGEDVLAALSNDGRSPESLRAALEELLGDGPAVVFTDLQAGSCALAAVATTRRRNTVVLCGANLPMLLDFVFHRDTPLDALADRLVEKGRDGIRSLKASVGPPAAAADGSAAKRDG
jgi:mannose/fructose-specific phosphotransferase system component IIA